MILSFEEEKRQMKKVKELLKDYIHLGSCLSAYTYDEIPVRKSAITKREKFYLESQNIINNVDLAISKLHYEQQKIIRECYLIYKPKSDKELFSEMNISRAKYYKLKKKALMQLYVTLDLMD